MALSSRSIGLAAILFAACASPRGDQAAYAVRPFPPGSELCAPEQPQRLVRRNDASPGRVELRYPPDAAVSGIQGWVCVEYSLGIDGDVTDAYVVASAPQGVFERAALDEVRQWEFEVPLVDSWLLGGQQVLVRFEIAQPARSESGE